MESKGGREVAFRITGKDLKLVLQVAAQLADCLLIALVVHPGTGLIRLDEAGLFQYLHVVGDRRLSEFDSVLNVARVQPVSIR